MLKNQQARRGALLLIGLAAFVVALALDLWTKHWVWTHLRPTGRVVDVWSPTLELAFALNRGTAFSVVREVEQPLWFLPITAVVVGLSMFIALRTPGVDRLRVAALGLVCGGALGNLHDRLFRVDELGHHGVVDFIKVNYPWGGSWPTFNVADSALVVGTILLMWSLSRAPE
ncbi:MAG TPA: signal peptidase II [Enhygromyxa sp.]|nr:signal peptidase II [Enhygromyxa sp.]